MELVRSRNLARFVAEMLSLFSLSLAFLKAVDLLDPAQLTPRRIVHFRMLMEAIFDNSDALVWNIFTRVAASPELEMLRTGLLFFIKQYVAAANPEKSVAAEYKIVRKALQNVAGVLMWSYSYVHLAVLKWWISLLWCKSDSVIHVVYIRGG